MHVPAGVLHGAAISGGQSIGRGWRERMGVDRVLPVHVSLRLPHPGQPLPCHQVRWRVPASAAAWWWCMFPLVVLGGCLFMLVALEVEGG